MPSLATSKRLESSLSAGTLTVFPSGADLVWNAFGRQPAGQGLCVGGFHPGHERLVVGSDEQVSEEKDHPDDQRSSAHQHDELLGIERRDGVLSLIRKLSKRCHGLLDCSALLELHARDFLIRAYDLVPHLHHQLKRDVRFLDGDHDVVNIAAIALQQIRDLLLRASVKLLPPG